MINAAIARLFVNSCLIDVKRKSFEMIKLKDILAVFEQAAPFSLQESYDNSGIQIGSPDQIVSKALVCIDVTEAILAEALQKGCDLIIAHHPLLFKGLKRITGQHYTERVVMGALQHKIAILAVHTNLDSVQDGVNKKLGEKLGLEKLRILKTRRGLLRKLVSFCPHEHAEAVRAALFNAGAGHIGNYDACSFNLRGEGTFRAGAQANPFVGERGSLHLEAETRIETIFPAHLERSVLEALHHAHPYEEVAYDVYTLENASPGIGMGMIGELPEAIAELAFLSQIKQNLGIACIKHSPMTGRMIKTVAFCGGSGSELLPIAINLGADAFLTGDLKYHQYFDAIGNILLADVGHYESEQFTKEIMCEIVTKKITKFAVLISENNTNPICYY